MSKQVINVGTSANSRDGDNLRTGFIKVNANFQELYDALAAQTGGGSSGSVSDINISGNVQTADGVIIIDSTTGKFTLEAVPEFVPIEYQFRVNFGSDGFMTTAQDLPKDWAYTINANSITLRHTVGRRPATITYWGYSANDQSFHLRHPTAGYQATVSTTVANTFTLQLNAAVTGADSGQYALITVFF